MTSDLTNVPVFPITPCTEHAERKGHVKPSWLGYCTREREKEREEKEGTMPLLTVRFVQIRLLIRLLEANPASINSFLFWKGGSVGVSLSPYMIVIS